MDGDDGEEIELGGDDHALTTPRPPKRPSFLKGRHIYYYFCPIRHMLRHLLWNPPRNTDFITIMHVKECTSPGKSGES